VRAITFSDRLAYTDSCPTPRAGDGECVVAVLMAGICSTDHQITKGYMGFAGILGHEMVGRVVEGSADWIGKRVVCEINCVCRACDMCHAGLSTHCRKRTVLGISGRDGCFADFVIVPESNLHAVPPVIEDERAVFVEPLAAAFQVIRQVPIESRTRAAVVGSGRLGLLVAQVLADTGCALEVIGRNPRTLEWCDKKGIQSRSVDDVLPKQDWDVVVECSGSPEGLGMAERLVRPRGTIVLKSTYAGPSNSDLSSVVVNEVSVLGSRCGPFADALNALSRDAVDVSTMISGICSIEDGLDAFEASARRDTIKVLLKIGAE
jgi:threonine dehydrogenase-like Zn-dependent dehydrogenase